MEKKIEGKMKSVASIPANYVSILQLQERWTKEQERKQKEKDLEERGVKQQVNGQGRREEEEDVINVTETTQSREKLEDRWKKEAKCVEKEKLEVSANKEENGGGGGDSRRRKKKRSKKKENKKQGGSVEKIVECESNVYIRRENNNNNNNQGDRIVQNRENAASDSIAVETQFQDLRIKKRDQEEEKEVKRPARQGGYYRNQKHDWSSSTRVIRAKGSGAMVWVKKRNSDGAAGENGV